VYSHLDWVTDMTLNRIFLIGGLALIAFAFVLGQGATDKGNRQSEALRSADQSLRADLAALPADTRGSSRAANRSTNVRKKDGTFDERDNDLQILCEDWRFYRGRIVKASAAGDEKAAAEARQKFQRITRWLDAYPDDEVASACTPR
jgi:hypothetical protein